MTDKAIYQFLLSADGVNQSGRLQAALDPNQVHIDGRSMPDLVRFICDMSAQIRYYDLNNQPQGDWLPFFTAVQQGNESLPSETLEKLIAGHDDMPPHLALLFAFLRVFSHAQRDVNTLAARRLRYYYEEVLRLKRRLAKPDQVHVLFELGKNASPLLVKAGTLLGAGKTASGAPLQYTLDSDLVLTHMTIGGLKSSYVDVGIGGVKVVFKAENAKDVSTSSASSWRPFGTTQRSIAPEHRTMEPVALGWAVASPNLLLAEGERTIKLTLRLKSSIGKVSPEMVLTSGLYISLTGEDGWIVPDSVVKAVLTPDVAFEDQQPNVQYLFTLAVWVVLNEASAAIIAYDESIHQESFNTCWPVMRMQLLPFSHLLEDLSGFVVEEISIDVEAKGVKNLILQNDQVVQPTDKPILPFGSTPVIGSNFYIGSKEVFSKSLTGVTVKLEWQDPPEDIVDYYSAYGNDKIIPGSFTANVDLLAGRKWDVRLMNNRTLFNSHGPSLVQEMLVSTAVFAERIAGSLFKRNPDLEFPPSLTHNTKQGFIKVVLSGPTAHALGHQPAAAPFEAFGHKAFASAYTKQAIALSRFTAESGTPPALPKPPYTPVLKAVALDYTAKDVFKPLAPNGIDQYFMLDTFGTAEIDKHDAAPLIPAQPGKGSLYIGLEGTNETQLISLLFQAEEGNVPGETLLSSSDLHWSYLAGNQWKPIASSNVVYESTEGLQKPGLIRLLIGNDASLMHNLMPRSMRWLRLSVDENTEGASALETIDTQAASATLVLPDQASTAYDAHLSAPLAPEHITGLAIKVPAIKHVSQPYPSFGGVPAESDDSFYRRISERLRHKNRATSAWDYEHLLLEYFPDIYKVKCLPHTDTADTLRPGSVRLAVVPDWRKRPTGNPLQPRANRIFLREMTDFMTNKFLSPFTEFHVTNPVYEALLVDCKISFQPGFDAGYYVVQLEEEIKKFLSPWAYTEGQDITFGGKIHASEILGFIEGREYVDFVTDFELYHQHRGHVGGGIADMEVGLDFVVGYTPEPSIADSIKGIGGKVINVDFVIGNPVEVAVATRPDTILVSHATHRIGPLQAGSSACHGVWNIGIGQLIIGLDFVPIS